jgi:hypothetical protein
LTSRSVKPLLGWGALVKKALAVAVFIFVVYVVVQPVGAMHLLNNGFHELHGAALSMDRFARGLRW